MPPELVENYVMCHPALASQSYFYLSSLVPAPVVDEDDPIEEKDDDPVVDEDDDATSDEDDEDEDEDDISDEDISDEDPAPVPDDISDEEPAPVDAAPAPVPDDISAPAPVPPSPDAMSPSARSMDRDPRCAPLVRPAAAAQMTKAVKR